MKVLFVCRGNICRSPTAHGIFLSLLGGGSLFADIEVDSAGTHACIGSQPSYFSQKTAKAQGIDISGMRSRQLIGQDFDYYDLIVAMDRYNLEYMSTNCPDRHKHKLKLLLDYAVDSGATDVPDPYSQDVQGFEIVYDLVKQGCLGLLRAIQKRKRDLGFSVGNTSFS